MHILGAQNCEQSSVISGRLFIIPQDSTGEIEIKYPILKPTVASCVYNASH
jgi:hypothetical protein